jgi:hypothetical protein
MNLISSINNKIILCFNRRRNKVKAKYYLMHHKYKVRFTLFNQL